MNVIDIPPLVDYDKAEITGSEGPGTPEEILESVNWKPDEWTVTRALLTAKGGKVTPKVWVHKNIIKPARVDGPRYKVVPRKVTDSGELWIVASDYQCPYYNERAQEELCGIVYRNKPDHFVFNGDNMDFPTISRYDPNPYHDTHVNAGIQSFYDVVRMVREVGPKYMLIDITEGNHDIRLRKYLVKHASALYDIKRANETQNILDVRHLCRLDELDARWEQGDVGGPGWPTSSLKVTDELYIKHGWFARRGSGATARAAMENLGVGLIVGHTHRLCVEYVSKPMTGKVYVGAESGTMCQVEGGLGHAVEPDWQNGALAVRVYSNGQCSIEPLRFVDGKFLYSGLR
jgi:hypothetical protein